MKPFFCPRGHNPPQNNLWHVKVKDQRVNGNGVPATGMLFWERKHEICEECDHFEHPRNTQIKTIIFLRKDHPEFIFLG